ncbi:hypothetical protein QF025_006576 [Paraburkholderia graminis]|uniref:MarR family transcriptional regulator n=1 Tax=Paraburkholderia graminis TaxID=60548 RepID=A0ABD5CSL1_9BURK|nr:hypothetical protein [Paraburkholderia graminis]
MQLSAHEIATLMVAASMPSESDISRPDFRVLVDRGLVRVDSQDRNRPLVRVSAAGHQAVRRILATCPEREGEPTYQFFWAGAFPRGL